MGRHAQAARRGRAPTAGEPPAPPPPVLTDIAGDLVAVTAPAVGNLGGQSVLEGGDSGSGPWTERGRVAYDDALDWSVQIELTDHWYRAYSVGNGTDYSGNSDYSNSYNWP